MRVEVPAQLIKTVPLNIIRSHHAGTMTCSTPLVVPNLKEEVIHFLVHGHIIYNVLLLQKVVNCYGRFSIFIIIKAYRLIELYIKVINPIF